MENNEIQLSITPGIHSRRNNCVIEEDVKPAELEITNKCNF